MKWIDLPPVWLFATLLAAWGLGSVWQLPDSGWTSPAGAVLVLAGLGLMVAAVREMTRARTTVIPHNDPSALVTSGVFRLSRNPIYLGDALVLAGFILHWQAVLAVPLLPLFLWVIQRRFILPEEARLRRGFGPTFEAWAARTRRWV
jgi:protein-S-isoprenylcysteine O-methyltransferase Ste14